MRSGRDVGNFGIFLAVELIWGIWEFFGCSDDLGFLVVELIYIADDYKNYLADDFK
ncbi:hypothetical protein Hanom_Chr03g00234431 [Helianthus anomalus]